MNQSQIIQTEVNPSAQLNVEFDISGQTTSVPVGQNLNAKEIFPIQTEHRNSSTYNVTNQKLLRSNVDEKNGGNFATQEPLQIRT